MGIKGLKHNFQPLGATV